MELSKTDVNYLYKLYKLRCMTLNQSYEYFYFQKYTNIQELYKERMKPLIESKIISFTMVNNELVFSITQKGINFLKNTLNIPTEVFNIQTNKTEPGMLSAADIEIEPRYLNHQISLNDFVLEFEARFTQPCTYFDEKYLSSMSAIRPDGMFQIGNVDLFLEQDMGTESKKQLQDKWARYRRYLTFEFKHDHKIVVLFILDCQKIDSRKNLVRQSIINSFDTMLTNDFDVFIGDKEEMLDAAINFALKGQKEQTREYIGIMKRFNIKVDDGSKLKMILNGSVYRYYLSATKDNKLIYYNSEKRKQGRFVEFLSDIYDYQPISVLSKILYHDKNSKNFDIAYSPKIPNMRLIGYIVVARDIYQLHNDLQVVGLIGTPNVYFTTFERLKKYDLPRALFTFNEQGDILTCKNYYFEPLINEGPLTNFSKEGLKVVFS